MILELLAGLEQVRSRRDVAAGVKEGRGSRRVKGLDVDDLKAALQQWGQAGMRPWHVDAHPLSPSLCPRCRGQDTWRSMLWRAHSHRSHDPSLGQEQAFFYQPHICVANDNASPSKPEGNALLLLYPKSVIHRSSLPTDLSIPLNQGRVLGLSLEHFDVDGQRFLVSLPLPLEVKVRKDWLHAITNIECLCSRVRRTHRTMDRVLTGQHMLKQSLPQPG